MKYLSLRYRIYGHELKQLRAAISQLGMVFAAFFINVLVPVFWLSALMTIGFIADPGLPKGERLIYQGFYLLLLYGLVRVQAKAIKATPYRHYIDTLPFGKIQHRTCDILMLLLAGNLLLLTPLALCLYIPDAHTLEQSLFFVLFAVAVVVTGFTAVYRHHPPLLSLLLVPLLASLYAAPLSATMLNGLWFGAVIAEWLFADRWRWSARRLSPKGYLAVVLLFVAHRPMNLIARGLAVALILSCYGYLVAKRPDFASAKLQLGVSLAIAFLIGSYQFEMERLREQYGYYLATFPLGAGFRRWVESIPPAALGLSVAALSYWAVDFSTLMTALELMLIALSAIGVARLGQYYYVLPSVPSAVLFLWLLWQEMSVVSLNG